MIPFIVAGILLAVLVGYFWWRLRSTIDKTPSEAVKAARMVWVERWGLPEKKQPSICAVTQRHLNCANGLGYMTPYNVCVGGETRPFGNGYVCTIAFPDNTPMHLTALAHEFMHARRWLQFPETSYEPENVAHASPGFMEEINATNAWLERQGM